MTASPPAPSGAAPSSARRISSLDSVRGIAALMVVFWHIAANFFGLAGWGVVQPHSWAAERSVHEGPLSVIISGTFAVVMFFILSGYVLTISFFRSGDLRQVARLLAGRVPRLFVPSAAAALFAAAALGLFWPSLSPVFVENLKALGCYDFIGPYINLDPDLSPAGLLLNLFWYPWFDPQFHHMYLGVLWTMSIELSGSFLVLILAALFWLLGGRPLAGAGLLLAGIAIGSYFSTYGIYFFFFLAGGAIAALDPPPRANSWLNTVAAATAVLIGLYLGGYAAKPISGWLVDHTPLPWSFSSLVAVKGLGAVLVFLAVILSPRLNDALRARPLVFLGHISFSLYLIHPLVILYLGTLTASWLAPVLGFSWAPLAVAAVCLTLSLISAWAVTGLIDRPAIQLSRWAGRRLVP